MMEKKDFQCNDKDNDDNNETNNNVNDLDVESTDIDDNNSTNEPCNESTIDTSSDENVNNCIETLELYFKFTSNKYPILALSFNFSIFSTVQSSLFHLNPPFGK